MWNVGKIYRTLQRVQCPNDKLLIYKNIAVNSLDSESSSFSYGMQDFEQMTKHLWASLPPSVK